MRSEITIETETIVYVRRGAMVTRRRPRTFLGRVRMLLRRVLGKVRGLVAF